MGKPAVAGRYVTQDFKQAPLIALADIMGLKSYQAVIQASPELYSPILSGIAVYRHLPTNVKQQVNNAIVHGIPRSGLTSRLLELVADQSVQPYWFMWSLSDDELTEFFQFSTNTVDITDQFNPLSPPNLTVTTIASGVFLLSKSGGRALASEALSSVRKSDLVTMLALEPGYRVVSCARDVVSRDIEDR